MSADDAKIAAALTNLVHSALLSKTQGQDATAYKQ